MTEDKTPVRFETPADVNYVEETESGTLSIVAPCEPDLFLGLEIDGGLGRFAHYCSIIHKLEVFEKIAGEEGGRVALALIGANKIVGYAACWYPGPDERWSKLGKLMYEMGAIEVSRNFRKLRIGNRLLERLLAAPLFDDKIAYMNGFSWHWDLDGSAMTIAEYRRMMIRLLNPYGFQEFYTNEPNIAIREENVFMARIGSRVSDEDRGRFRSLRFGVIR